MSEKKRVEKSDAIEALLAEDEAAIIVFGDGSFRMLMPHEGSDDETHSCDAMGCGSLGNHVVERFQREVR